MSSIAFENGFFWRTLWNHPANAALKTLRKNPNVLMTGDIVHLPDLTVKKVSGATESRHKFLLKGIPEKLRMKLLDEDHQPRANLEYTIIIEGNARKGKTNGQGQLVEKIPPTAKSGKLIFAASPGKDGKPVPGQPKFRTLKLQLGSLNPLSSVSGLKARLANVGCYKGPIDENMDGPTKQAIRVFQTKKGLPVTGVADDATKSQLQKIHGH